MLGSLTFNVDMCSIAGMFASVYLIVVEINTHSLSLALYLPQGRRGIPRL